MHSRPPAPVHQPLGRRALAVASVAYVAALAVWADAGREPLAWVAGVLGVLLVAVTSGSRLAPVRASGWASGVAVAAMSARAGDRLLYALGAAGIFVAIAAACLAIARIPADGGLAERRTVSPLPAIVAAGAAWWWAGGARFVSPPG